MKDDTKILIVDDNEDVLFAAKLLFKPIANKIQTEKDPKKIPELIRKTNYDVILLDMNFTEDMTSGTEGIFWLKEILKLDPLAVVILITAYGDIESAVKSVKMGATDFILKPWQNEKLLATVTSAIRQRKAKLEIENLRSKNELISNELNSMFPNMIGISVAMKKIFDTIKKVATTDANVLILGENGTGKGLVAREIHKHSKRNKEIFMNVDLGAISKSLFESELFGHTKGAFTDAHENKPGRFELADKGTIFLDEIGNINIETQAKLLSVIEKKEVTRVGATISKPFDVRILSATNLNPDEMIENNLFREDLLYRINTVVINIPPLRERREDIPPLIEFYLDKNKQKYHKPNLKITKSAISQLQNYDFPGNVRELEHIIERAIILSDSNTLNLDDFDLKKSKNSNSISNNLAEIEKKKIVEILNKNNGNISLTAKELGLTRTSLYRRISKYNLDVK